MKNCTNKLGRRALALLLALTMCFSMVMSAAAETDIYACDYEEHTHDVSCYEYKILTCGLGEGENTIGYHPEHTDDCYAFTRGDQICPLDEVANGHKHNNDEECFETVYTCGLDGKWVDTGAYDDEGNPIQQLHEHSSDCGTSTILICQKTEVDTHLHDDNCFERVKTDEIKCNGIVPAHSHGSCYAYIMGNAVTAEQGNAWATENGASSWSEVCANPAAYNNPGSDNCSLRCGKTEHTHGSGCKLEDSANFVQQKLNGGTLTEGTTLHISSDVTLNVSDSLKVTGANVTITGEGTIQAVTEGASKGFPVITIEGGKLTINGVTITGGKNTGDNGNGGGVYLNGGELELKNGKIAGNEAQRGGGVYVAGGTFTMTGGEISDNTATNDSKKSEGESSDNAATNDSNESKWDAINQYGDFKGQGGGVYVNSQNKTSYFNLSGGEISRNTAAEGGGVMVSTSSSWNGDKTIRFNMTGGKVRENTALVGEGGGIYVKGFAQISKGLIEGNKTLTTTDLGGGGIYVEKDAKLTLYNALITENNAAGLGAGVAACVHGSTIIFAQNGAAIFDNTSAGNAVVQPKWLVKDEKGNYSWTTTAPTDTDDADSKKYTAQFIDQSYIWNGLTNIKDLANDIMIGANATEDGKNGIFVSNNMLGTSEDNTANWTGISYDKVTHKSGCPYAKKEGACTCGVDHFKGQGHNIDPSSVISATHFTGLTAHVSAAVAEAMKNFVNNGESGVVIRGNSSNTHGGGLGNNGTVVFGSNEHKDKDTVDISVVVSKKWDGDTNFLTEVPTATIGVFEGGSLIASTTITGDASGEISIPHNVLVAGMSGNTATHTFTVKEISHTPVEGVTAGTDSYTFQVTVKKSTKTFPDPDKENASITTTSYSITSNGAEGNVYTFTNTYTTPRGKLTISKNIGEGSVLDADAVADKEFKFLVEGPGDSKVDNASFANGKAEVTVKGTGSITISNLPVGNYTVTEIDGEMSGYTYKAVVNGDGSVKKDESAEITVTNTYDYQRGSLTLSKKIVNNTSDFDAANQKYTFKITGEMLDKDDAEGKPYYNYQLGEDKALYVSIFGAEKKTISGLPYGEYTVTELKDSVELDETKYNWIISNDNQNGAVINSAEGTVVEVTNTFDYYRGSLTINKVITGAASTSLTQDKVFTFTVTGPDYVTGIYDGVTFEKGNATVTITGDGQKTISGLPAGTYRVHEENALLAGYTWTVKGNDQSVVVIEDGNAAVTVTNTYDVPFIPTTKSLTVNKAWAGDEDAGIQRPASVQVQLMVNGAAYGSPVTLSSANDWRHTWTGLAENAVLSVKEIDVPAGYEASTSQNGSTIVITNTYKVQPTPTPTPTPSNEPEPTPDIPDDDIPDDDVPLGPGPNVTPEPTPDIPDDDIPDDDVPLGPGPNVTPEPEATPTPEPDEELPDPDVPTGPSEPEEEDIPDDDVPLANAPKTGDDTNIWYVLTILSAAGLVFLAATGRKRKVSGK